MSIFWIASCGNPNSSQVEKAPSYSSVKYCRDVQSCYNACVENYKFKTESECAGDMASRGVMYSGSPRDYCRSNNQEHCLSREI